MNVDWTVAIAIFMMFSVWSVYYYLDFFSQEPVISQDTVAGKIVDFLETDVYSLPVSHDSSSPGTAVLYADLPLEPAYQSGLRILSGTSSQPCMIQSGRLYWESDLSAGENLFLIEYSDSSTGGCSDSLSTSGANQTYPMTAAVSREISSSTLSALSISPYDSFRSSLDIPNQARLEWSGADQGSFGPSVPPNVDVSSFETSRPHLESSGEIDLRVLTWE